MIVPEQLAPLLMRISKMEAEAMMLLAEIQLMPCDPVRPTTDALQHMHTGAQGIAKSRSALLQAFQMADPSRPFESHPVNTFAGLEVIDVTPDVDTPPEMKKRRK